MPFTTKFQEIAKNSNLRCQLAVALDVSYFTICRYLEDPKSDELTKPKHLSDLVRIFKLNEEEIFEKQTV